MPRIYLDHVTTTPLEARVAAAMAPYLGSAFGSPSPLHTRGRRIRSALETARAQVAGLVHSQPEEILFTSSATEANNLALKGVLLRAARPGRVLVAATEHISVLHPLRSLARLGYESVALAVDADGRLDPDRLDHALRAGALLVSVAHASAEVGTLQPIDEIVRRTRRHGVPLHCDATATAGHVELPEASLIPDLVTFAPHLFNGPQGVAALRVASALDLRPLVEGGVQEQGLRPGTEPVAAIVGFGVAADIATSEGAASSAVASRRAASLRALIGKAVQEIRFTGDPTGRIPGHLSLCVRGAEAEALLRALDGDGIEAASGSACTTEAGKPSHVLQAIGIDPLLARGALTFMFGLGNDDDDPTLVATSLAGAVARLRALSPGI